jgi:hypothetical protein
LSLRLQLLQVARLAPRLLGDSTDLVRAFFERQWTTSGGARNRAGRPDLYYTIFNLAGLQALNGPIPHDRVATFLESFGDGDGLDFVHLGALARCWAAVGADRLPDHRARALLEKLETYRKPDGGYEGDVRLPYGTAYGAFVALGAYQDLGQNPPHALQLIQGLRGLVSADGVWSNVPGAKLGATNATAGAVTLIRHLGLPVSATAGDWLLAQAHPQGGFVAVPGIPIPDLLSTATALHALSSLERRIPSTIHERCLDFVDTLWSAEGGFHGQWTDDELDAEYTFYGLLALGHLSL